eukprot:78779-Amorphochlora_amoeboformis.AAC.1
MNECGVLILACNRQSMDDRSDSDLSWDEKHRRLASMKAKEAASLERTEDLEAANLSGSEEVPFFLRCQT